MSAQSTSSAMLPSNDEVQTTTTANTRVKPKLNSRGNRGRGRGRTATRPAPLQSIAPPIPATPPISGVPPPRFKSTEATPPKNDPLVEEFDAAGFAGLMPFRPANEFAITCEGFLPLVERQYRQLSTADRNFVKNIPCSVFTWAMCQHLYARMIAIKRHTQDVTAVEDRLCDYVQSENYPLPAAIDSYIKGIGDVTDSSGVNYKLKFPAWPETTGRDAGTFLRVGPNTHWKYASLPAPKVLVLRILADLDYTLHPDHARNWNLPAELVPEGTPGTPTSNLLGWAPSTTLSSEQRTLLEGTGIQQNVFDVSNPQFQMNRPLFECVADYLRLTDKAQKLGTVPRPQVTGSAAQQSWTEVDIHGEYQFSRTTPYTEGQIRQGGAYQQDARVIQAALVCSFRVLKNNVGLLRPYAVYDWAEYAEVPDEWHATRNTTYEFGRQVDWNINKLYTAYSSKDDFRTAWIKRNLILKEKG